MTLETQLLANLTADEVGAQLQRSRVVLVPVGSREQHGPLAPFCTDALLATAVCERVASRIDALSSRR